MKTFYQSFWLAAFVALYVCGGMSPHTSAIAQEASGGGDDPPALSQQRFPFEAYNYFRIEIVDDELLLVPIDRHALGLYTPVEHFQQALNLGSAAWSAMAGNYWSAWGQMGDAGQWLSAFTVTLASQGHGIVMVKKQDDDGGEPPTSPANPVDQVIVIVSCYGPYPGFDHNNSIDVSAVICEKLKEHGVACENVVMDVIWGAPDKKVDEVVTDTKTNHPDKKIIWIGLGVDPVRRKFNLETVGQNEQGQFPDASNPPVIPTPGSQNEPGGPPTSEAGYDPETIICTLFSHGVEINVSTDAFQYLCDALTFKLHRMDEQGLIDCGIFIHIPPVTDGKINDKFADGLLDVIETLAEELTNPDGEGDGNQGGGISGGGEQE